MVKKHSFWAAVFLLLLLGAAAALFLQKSSGGGGVARVISEGRIVREIDLATVAEPYEFTVESTKGSNTVRVEPGRIMVSDADCPDRVCQKTGAISGGAYPLLCLPHELVIEIVGGNEEYDAAAGGIS